MKDTIQIAILSEDQQVREQLIAQLSEIEFDAFEEKENQLIAFIPAENFNAALLDEVLLAYGVPFATTRIEEQNWNKLWESNFHPVVVEDFCVIRAEFHPPFKKFTHEIIITPKMSFGTGHHATTFMMISQMRTLNFTDKKVADFGTGTGVLAILAEKMGSNYVWAIDMDDWSIDNASENIQRNNCLKIELEKQDSFDPRQQFDIILANINRNVILDSVDDICKGTILATKVLLSGLLKEDEGQIVAAFNKRGFKHHYTVEKNNWICLLLQYVLKFG